MSDDFLSDLEKEFMLDEDQEPDPLFLEEEDDDLDDEEEIEDSELSKAMYELAMLDYTLIPDTSYTKRYRKKFIKQHPCLQDSYYGDTPDIRRELHIGRWSHRYKEDLSDDTLARMRESHQRKNLSEYTLYRMRESHLGIKKSETTKQKISMANKNKTVSLKTKQKISESKKNVKRDPKTARILRNNRKGINHTEESKHKIRYKQWVNRYGVVGANIRDRAYKEHEYKVSKDIEDINTNKQQRALKRKLSFNLDYPWSYYISIYGINNLIEKMSDIKNIDLDIQQKLLENEQQYLRKKF